MRPRGLLIEADIVVCFARAPRIGSRGIHAPAMRSLQSLCVQIRFQASRRPKIQACQFIGATYVQETAVSSRAPSGGVRQEQDEPLRKRLIGTWSLVSTEDRMTDGSDERSRMLVQEERRISSTRQTAICAELMN